MEIQYELPLEEMAAILMPNQRQDPRTQINQETGLPYFPDSNMPKEIYLGPGDTRTTRDGRGNENPRPNYTERGDPLGPWRNAHFDQVEKAYMDTRKNPDRSGRARPKKYSGKYWKKRGKWGTPWRN